ncbi:30S ribosomal protein S13 [Holospora obtusa F1]|uniref:Small ribosomal subunit protein uS13 n=1 Tax=Holospora obtusa F1 TaxID=1399147 RepID=W6TFC0_HOLOB|nr:30S ribosomal protein S13 [Holospora obtusa]ETZ07701.1 30S ribosomal protein S13 [Holospora obtusa F1]
MARISGVNISEKKNLLSGLICIHGIGRSKALEICNALGIDYHTRISSLSEKDIVRIREVIDKEYVVEGELRNNNLMSKKRLMDLGCYRGLRHRKNLPVRGQRTHTNARTRRGRAVAIAGKKK